MHIKANQYIGTDAEFGSAWTRDAHGNITVCGHMKNILHLFNSKLQFCFLFLHMFMHLMCLYLIWWPTGRNALQRVNAPQRRNYAKQRETNPTEKSSQLYCQICYTCPTYSIL